MRSWEEVPGNKGYGLAVTSLHRIDDDRNGQEVIPGCVGIGIREKNGQGEILSFESRSALERTIERLQEAMEHAFPKP